MKRFIFAYIAFAIVFLFLYALKPKYTEDQIGKFVRVGSIPEVSENCSSTRKFVALYERPDKTRYYLCKRNFPFTSTYTEKFKSFEFWIISRILLSFIVAVFVYYFKNFIHFLNS